MSQLIKRLLHSAIQGRGSLPKTCGILCFENQGLGGEFLWTSILKELAVTPIPSGKLTLVSLDVTSMRLKEICDDSGVGIHCLDLNSDPEEWLESQNCSSVTFDSVEVRLMHQLEEKTFIVIDRLSPLALRCTFPKVLKMLDTLRKHSNCLGILISVDRDAHSEVELKAIRALCTGVLKMFTPKEVLLPLAETQPHGAVQSLQITETGTRTFLLMGLMVCILSRMESRSEWFKVQCSGEVYFFSPPDESQINSIRLVEANVPTPAKERIEDADDADYKESLMHQMEGGMKLTLTQNERNAKEEVLLPYEKVSHLSRLGEIHYERDSEEALDSDEDPDDDLDI